MKTHLTAFTLSFAALGLTLLWIPGPAASQQKKVAKVHIGGVTLRVEVCNTPEERSKGLGNRERLDKDHGMLFVHDTPDIHSYWMKGMRFPLDFVWIEGGTVKDLHENVPPPRSPSDRLVMISPAVPVRYVLEVNAGWISRHGVKRGDVVFIVF